MRSRRIYHRCSLCSARRPLHALCRARYEPVDGSRTSGVWDLICTHCLADVPSMVSTLRGAYQLELTAP